MRRILAGIVSLSVLACAGASVASARATNDTMHAQPVMSPTGRTAAVVTFSIARPTRPFKQIGILVVPRLKLRSPIYLGITDAIFDVGVGQWPGTARPGRAGNTVIGGHRTGGMMPFLKIDTIRKGDKIKVIVGTKTFTYTVTTTRIISPQDVTITRQTKTPTLTLFSCHPPHSIQKRYVVRAALTS